MTAQTDPKREARELRKALRKLSDDVLLFLQWMDQTVGPNREIPRELSARLGKACAALDMSNDSARRFALGLGISAADKARAAAALAPKEQA